MFECRWVSLILKEPDTGNELPLTSNTASVTSVQMFRSSHWFHSQFSYCWTSTVMMKTMWLQNSLWMS